MPQKPKSKFNMSEKTIFRRIGEEETNYATHHLYRYPGQFVPQIPRFLIEKFSKKYDVVLDPFCGSGTTLVEANLLHRNSYGIDVNPIARLVTKVKTKKISMSNDELIRITNINNFDDFDEIRKECKKFEYGYLFNGENLMQLLKLRKEIYENYTDDIRNFLLVCLLSIVKSCANIDASKVRIVREKKDTINVFEIFKKTVHVNLKKLTSLNTDVFAEVLNCDYPDSFGDLNEPENAKKISLETQTIDLVVTSPPYLNALNYIKIHRIEMALLNEKVDEKNYIGVDKEIEITESSDASKKLMAIEIYFKDMENAISEISRVLKSNGVCGMIIDKDRKIKNVRFKFANELIERAKNYNMVLEDKFYRYATKENKSEGERMLVFRKI
ncbi:hypothetical protein MSIBF_A4290002 [groundwater metagenome]|uniref:site-specific DNA-methyltransferase (cytosine-N(4)-specific) n=1 Tax=groundwater metagenome TaxID=717931 RepID=A0A098EF02_9ZZZZ